MRLGYESAIEGSDLSPGTPIPSPRLGSYENKFVRREGSARQGLERRSGSIPSGRG
jgi:hypothetical protein